MEKKIKEQQIKSAKRVTESFKVRSCSNAPSQGASPRQKSYRTIDPPNGQKFVTVPLRQSYEPPRSKSFYPVVRMPTFAEKSKRKLIGDSLNRKKIISAYKPHVDKLRNHGGPKETKIGILPLTLLI